MAKVLFVQKFDFNERFHHIEKIGIAQISSVLKENGHECKLVLTEYTHKIIDFIKIYRPDIIAFSITTPEVFSYLKIASKIKKSGINSLIVVGGPHPTFNTDIIENKYIDIINIGEGEYSMLDLANALDEKKDYTKIKNFFVKKNGRIYKNKLRPLVDVDELPPPDRDIYLNYKIFKNQKEYVFVLSRGCPYNCNFCFVHKWKEIYHNDKNQNSIRFRSIEKSIEEIKLLSKKVKISLVVFGDSTFYIDKKWTIKFLKKYKEEIGIPFSINLRADMIDKELVETLHETKCCQSVRIGIEAGDERIRNVILNKNITNDQIYNAIDLLKKYKIKIMIYLMFGLPEETLNDAFKTVKMIQKVKPDIIRTAVFHPYPGLDLTSYSIKKGYLSENDLKNYEKESYGMFNSLLKQPEIEEVINLLKLSPIAINFPFLNPVIKKLSKFRTNIFFDIVYMSNFLKLFIMY